MKKRIVTAVITACLALCAAVWPQPDTREERPASIPTRAAAAPKAGCCDNGRKEKYGNAAGERTRSLVPFLVPASAEPTPAVETPQPEPKHPTPQPTIELQPGDEVYIPGFGWVPYEGPNHREYAADMYENGNKIGSMG